MECTMRLSKAAGWLLLMMMIGVVGISLVLILFGTRRAASHAGCTDQGSSFVCHSDRESPYPTAKEVQSSLTIHAPLVSSGVWASMAERREFIRKTTPSPSE